MLPEDFIHIYDWLEEPAKTEEEAHVKKYLNFRTYPAIFQSKFFNSIVGLKVFCKFQNQEYRIIGASRMGDVWLKILTDQVKEAQEPNGYDKRVCITDCYDFWYLDERENPEEKDLKLQKIYDRINEKNDQGSNDPVFEVLFEDRNNKSENGDTNG